ncbi:MAG: hypothetical protein V7606_4354 [Burkholderiales bacterium]
MSNLMNLNDFDDCPDGICIPINLDCVLTVYAKSVPRLDGF